MFTLPDVLHNSRRSFSGRNGTALQVTTNTLENSPTLRTLWRILCVLRGVGRCVCCLVLACLFDTPFGRTASIVLNGDPIGSDSSLTDNTGGFTAVRTATEDLGQPAILVSLSENLFLTELRVIAFGIPSPTNQLLFDDFAYHLDFWKSEDYSGNADPQFSVQLSDPVGISLVQFSPDRVLPEEVFGTSGPFAGNADTYDLRFDLTRLLADAHAENLFPSPLSAGEWVLGFQSRHEISTSGSLRVAGSIATEGPLPLFSRGELIPRGVLGGQDVEDIVLRWGISLSAADRLPGDFDADNDIDADDLVLWQTAYGLDEKGDADGDGDSDGTDFLIWQKNFGAGVVNSPSLSVPEPSLTALALLAANCLLSWRLFPRLAPAR